MTRRSGPAGGGIPLSHKGCSGVWNPFCMDETAAGERGLAGVVNQMI